MKEAEIIFKKGIVGRIKILWHALKLMRKSERFYLISIDNCKTENGIFTYDQRMVFNGLDAASWESFLCSHFNSVKNQKEFIKGINMLINKEGEHENQ